MPSHSRNTRIPHLAAAIILTILIAINSELMDSPTPPSAPTTAQLDHQDITAAPPQPPLPHTEPLPAIVHGIDPYAPNGLGLAIPLAPASSTSITSTSNLEHIPPPSQEEQPQQKQFLPSSSLSDVLSSLSERVQRAVRLANPNPTVRIPIPPPPPTIFLFGDSITELSLAASSTSASSTGAPGWSALLRADYANTADVTVRGHSGYNTRWALHILPSHLRSLLRSSSTPFIKVVTIFLGSNDAVASAEAQYVPIAEYARNLATMVSFVRSLGIIPLLIAPPPLSTLRYDVVHGGRIPENSAKYARACVSVAARVGCDVVDLHTSLLDQCGGDENALDALFTDGLHLSTKGNQAVYELIKEGIEKAVPEVAVGNLEPIAPLWSDIDSKNPAKTLGRSELVSEIDDDGREQ